MKEIGEVNGNFRRVIGWLFSLPLTLAFMEISASWP
jgi:hypothetical protein